MNHSAPDPRTLRISAAEWKALRWSPLYFFCLLTGYYLLRPVRDAMGASGDLEAIFPAVWIDWLVRRGVRFGDFTMQVLFTGTFLCMVALQPLYGALVSRFPRRIFLPAIYLLFVACLLLFHGAFRHEVSGLGAVFFVWTAVFNLFAVSVFWSYMADVYDNASAKRLYGYIGAGGTTCAVLGPLLTRPLAQWLGVGNRLLVSALFLSICIVCIIHTGAD